MELKNVFDNTDVEQLVNRINSLSDTTNGLWGKMDVSQMLAHCNVVYEMTYEDIHPKPKGLKKVLIKLLAKSTVVGKKPYKKNSRTAPQFLITTAKDFTLEKDRIITYINKTQQLGAEHFNNRESHSFGPLTTDEWNILFYKHLDHHLRQFGV